MWRGRLRAAHLSNEFIVAFVSQMAIDYEDRVNSAWKPKTESEEKVEQGLNWLPTE